MEEVELFKSFPESSWKGIAFQRYLIAVLNRGCLTEISYKYYKLDERKILEIDLYYEYDVEIKDCDYGILELIANYVDEYEDDAAIAAAEFKDSVLNTLIEEQYSLLSQMKDAIIYRSIDIDDISNRMSILQDKKAQMGKALTDLNPAS